MKGNKLKGEITIETAIVFPIVMLMVLLLIYFSMFLHDIVKMKSYAYEPDAHMQKWNLKILKVMLKRSFSQYHCLLQK